MSDNTVTLVLTGDVPLSEFSKALVNFTELVKALSEENGSPDLDWLVQDLSVGSTMATVAAPRGDLQKIQAVVDGFADVGASLEQGTEIKHSERVRIAGRKIVSIDDHRIKSVNFDTAKRAAIVPTQKPIIEVVSRETLRPSSVPRQALQSVGTTYGAIQGRIQTLTNRGSLRFTLYDILYDRAVSCYFADGKQEAILGLWGKLAMVEGLITRDPITGRPLSLRQVENITPLQESSSRFEYQEARGVSPSLTGLSAEDAIRRIRDAK